MRHAILLLSIITITLTVSSCKKASDSSSAPTSTVDVPKFNADSAYIYVQRQVDFGPRVPNTDAHRKTAAWLEQELKKAGAQVTIQSFKAPTWNGATLELKNIIASFNPEKQKRIMLAAHWDTRPFADKDSIHRDAPFDGANDGGSGVGVLLEIARAIKANPPRAGVDIVLFDGEDWGEKDNTTNRVPVPEEWDDWWCLGSQYWSENKHKPNYRPYYGILLDMVGAEDARFFREGGSVQYAPRIVDKVWNAASALGYSDTFIKADAGSITDDHYFVNTKAQIPMIDIVQYESNAGWGSFHHTTEDNMGVISKRMLEVVGSTVMWVVYQEE
ncbi:MAG TPA: M28 family peptidase [Cyclobacteriaceae bacterium]|nr:M28 family peptidase [Cyclobacteriaceae bacterium]